MKNNMNKIIIGTAIAMLVPFATFASVDSLNGQTGSTQTFVNDENVGLSSDSDTHTFTWSGVLSVLRGGTGMSSYATGSIPFFWNGVLSEDNNLLRWDEDSGTLYVGASYNGGKIMAAYNNGPDTGGGSMSIIGGNGDGTGTGGGLYLSAGNGGDYGDGADVELGAGGGGYYSGNGGSARISAAGPHVGTNGNGGSVFLQAAPGDGSGSNGQVYIGVGGDDVSATTTVNIGRASDINSHACFNTKNTDGDDISFYFVGTSMVVENNPCL
jgi:hypothetical protein